MIRLLSTNFLCFPQDSSSSLEKDRVEPRDRGDRAAAAAKKPIAPPNAKAANGVEDDERTENDIDLSYSIDADRPHARDGGVAAGVGVGQKHGAAAAASKPAGERPRPEVLPKPERESAGSETETEVSISLTETQLTLTASVLEVPDSPAEVEARLREQERRSAQTVELLTQRKRALKDKTRADIKWLEHERERLAARRDDFHQRADAKKERQCQRELHALERRLADLRDEYKRESVHIKCAPTIILIAAAIIMRSRCKYAYVRDCSRPLCFYLVLYYNLQY